MSDLPATWALTKLSEVAEVHDDLREPVNAKERARRAGPYPYYGATGQVGWIDAYRQDGEYVLLGEDGAPFLDPAKPKAYLVSGKAWVNNHAHVLSGLDGICHNRFLLHALNHADYRGYANGTTRLKLTQGAMLELPVRLAPISEQKRVVDKLEELLSDLDAGVAALGRAGANLKRYHAAVLKAAVDGRLTEKWRAAHPEIEPAERLLERILAERRKKWEESQFAKYAEKGQAPPKGWKDEYPEPLKPDVSALPPLPQRWCWSSTDELFGYVTSGSRGWAKYCGSEGDIFLGMGNLDHDTVTLDLLDFRKVMPPDGAEGQRTRVETNDILISITADVGMIGLAPQGLGTAYINQHLALARSVLPEIARYVAWNLVSRDGQRRLKGLQRGATKVGLGLDDVRSVAIPLAPLQEQAQLVSHLDAAASIVAHTNHELGRLKVKSARLRQSALSYAFEGRLVPQDPRDEPASELLARSKAEREEERVKRLIGKAKDLIKTRKKIRT